MSGGFAMKSARRALAALFATVGLAAVAAPAAAQAQRQPFFPPFGLDLTAIDRSTKPGDDFFQYVNGAWLGRTEIPPDKTSVTMGRMIQERTEAQLHELMEAAAAKAGHQPTTVEGKVGAYYKAFMDEKRIEGLGAKPIAPELAAIRAAKTRADLARLMGKSVDDFEGGFFGLGYDADLKDPNRYALYLAQAGLGLPDRDYYLTAQFAKAKQAYQDHADRLLTLIGWPEPKANAAAIVALETKIAEASWTKAEQRDLNRAYHAMSPAELAAYAPDFPWAAFLEGAKVGSARRVVVTQDTAFPKIAKVFADTPVPVLQAWLAFTVADNAAVYLSSPFQQAYFDLHLKTLGGQPEQQARWKRGVHLVGGGDCLGGVRYDCWGNLGWAVGEVYTAKHFPPETKAKVKALVADLMVAFHGRIEKLDWMSPATKAEALKKLDTYTVKVGYPDHPRDYSKVVILDDDAVGDARRAAEADWAFYRERADKPVDRLDWAMTPQTVDAYNGSLRDIVFPAAILQAPMFDPAADPAINYGGIGSVIGHELTHGFDDQGRTIDASGALRDWWTPQDAKAFEARAETLGAQYAAFEPAPGAHINPKLTMGENIADLGGLLIALDAYHASLKGQPAPVIGGLTGDQRVLLGYAQGWRGKAREDAIRQQTAADPHSYRKFRVDGVVPNVDVWYDAFSVQSGDKLYRAPADRARIW
jgi:putative endopeptidase